MQKWEKTEGGKAEGGKERRWEVGNGSWKWEFGSGKN
jgi:hypothetical protein